ncbi:MAG TPA: RdgB/HAM1 family non-canonical purine NTP pyrophosphatase [Fimbriiglobus sp.]|jgi:XTP/dITP diphosphohydrolase
MRLVLGSRNRKKLRELIELLSDLVEVTDLAPYPKAPEVEETGTTFEENARLKAVTLAPVLKQWVLGEDSGLVVPALGGQPGVYSARWAGTHGDDVANNTKLLTELSDKTGDERAAYYVSTAALADPTGKIVAVVDGKCWGRIASEPHGEGGFGYDPLFVIPEYHRSFGELSSVVKHALSHRGRAIGKLRPILRSLLSASG